MVAFTVINIDGATNALHQGKELTGAYVHWWLSFYTGLYFVCNTECGRERFSHTAKQVPPRITGVDFVYYVLDSVHSQPRLSDEGRWLGLYYCTLP